MMRISYTSTCRGCEISRGIIVPSVRRKHTTRTCVNLAPERVAIAPYIESDGEDGRAVGTFSKLTLGILSIIGPSTSSSTACMVLEQLGLDEEQVAWFARHRPELLHATTTEVRLRKRLVGLADLLGCTPTKAASMVQKQPALIDIDSSVIRRRLEGLARTLLLGSVAGGNVTDDGRSRAVRAARRMPLLLASAEHEGAVLESRLRQLAELLHLGDPAEAARLVEAEPLLLVLEPSRIRERIEALPALLDLPQGVRQAELLCAMHPFLLTVSDRSIAGKVNALGAALKLPRGAVLGVVLSYPQVLTFSEQAITGKVVALSEVISLDRLQAMVCDDPSLLARSSDKVLSTLRALQAATGKSMQQAIGLAERRPSILAKSAAAPSRNYRALSVWKLTAGEKDEMLQKHPVLLSMSSREVHLRCRWLRGLVTSNGYYHSGARRIPPALLGVIIMHLPQARGPTDVGSGRQISPPAVKVSSCICCKEDTGPQEF